MKSVSYGCRAIDRDMVQTTDTRRRTAERNVRARLLLVPHVLRERKTRDAVSLVLLYYAVFVDYLERWVLLALMLGIIQTFFFSYRRF